MYKKVMDTKLYARWLVTTETETNKLFLVIDLFLYCRFYRLDKSIDVFYMISFERKTA